MNSLVDPFIDPTTDMVFTKGAGVGAKCDQQRIGVRAHVHANLDLERKKPSQPTPQKNIKH